EGRAQNYLFPEHIEKIVSAWQAFADIAGFARVVSREELRDNDDNLNIRRYADNAPPSRAARRARAPLRRHPQGRGGGQAADLRGPGLGPGGPREEPCQQGERGRRLRLRVRREGQGRPKNAHRGRRGRRPPSRRPRRGRGWLVEAAAQGPRRPPPDAGVDGGP